MIFLSLTVHSLFYYFLPSTLTPLIKSYAVSTLHAVVCVCGVANFFVRYTINLKQGNRISGGGMHGTGDEVMVYSVCYSLGYFIYDLLLMLFDQSVRTKTAVIHHTIILVSFSAGKCVCFFFFNYFLKLIMIYRSKD